MRRSAEDRRAEIVDTACRIALGDGLESVTLRSVALRLSVTSGLVSHYFPSVDDLLAEVFGRLAGEEFDKAFAELDDLHTPSARVGRLLSRQVDAQRDDLSTLWIDGWQVGRRRKTVHDEVAHQTERWISGLADLIVHGCSTGDFTSANPRSSAVRIMAMIDGLSVQSTLRGTLDYDSVQELVFLVAENELGLAAGSLA